MKLIPSPNRLRILRDTIEALARDSDEKSRVHKVLGSLRKIGLQKCLFTVRVLTYGGKVIELRYVAQHAVNTKPLFNNSDSLLAVVQIAEPPGKGLDQSVRRAVDQLHFNCR